ncbi:related to EAR1-endosomal adaptor of Rsp5p [Sporisorium reilianum f. sp. reilianum]|uniref:Related to EAR1-endosomal adaptor of Rsp5p n=1 Tax=Sporisorium reilianum f. sp. reilianum TaxID=72559 RepID=A0A2N8UL46_9BASI|nr:related to EAR1-endosomal adaptor of Rsp5p [Sporisorium reilianum f. sp. reilianum]
MQNARNDDSASSGSGHPPSSSSPPSSPIKPSTNSLFSSSSRRSQPNPAAFRQSVLDMDALLTFTDDDRHADRDDLFDPVLPATKPRFKRPFGMSGERMFNQQLKSIGHAQDPSPTLKPFDIVHTPDEPVYQRPPTADDTLALLLPLLILLSTLLFLLLLFIILVIVVRRKARISLGDSDGPLDVGREEELEGTGGLDGIEQRWLETVEEPVQRGYRRAKDWILAYPPGTQSTDITLSQFLSIQEKGVSAWSFDPDYESNPSVFVEARTEITFTADGEGMAPQEGGGVCVQSNLPLPKINEVYYWEVKMFNKPDSTNVAVGLTTKPYPQFRLPGWSKYSIGYFSSDGFKCHNYPFAAQSYGPAYGQGDVIGIGYRPRTGTVFFTRNGKRLEDAFIGLNRYNLFPTVGADGACEIHVNLGQAGFVFIEANVKKWGLAPMVGTLAPPPAYGQERGTILMESGQGSSADANANTNAATSSSAGLPGRESPPPPISPYEERSPSSSHHRLAGAAVTSSPAPARTSLLRPSGQAVEAPRPMSRPMELDDSSDGSPPNPPTPHRLDISLHSLSDASTRGGGSSSSAQAEDSYFPATPPSPADPLPPAAVSNHSPPSYATAVEHGALGGTSASHHQARRGSGRTHQLANAVLGMLSDRGLLQPINHANPSPQPSPVPGGHGAYAGGLSEAEYERMLRANTARNSRGASGAADYSLHGWASWLGLRVGAGGEGSAARGRAGASAGRSAGPSSSGAASRA